MQRRDFMLGAGFGAVGLAGMASGATHHTAKAKHVIFLCMDGGPSHVDTFDYKPKLLADDGKSYSKSRGFGGKLLGSPWAFKKHGQSGTMISELFPELAKHADDWKTQCPFSRRLPRTRMHALRMRSGPNERLPLFRRCRSLW